MRRLELMFGAIVTALAVFVAVEARGARVYSAYLGGAVSAPIASSTDEPKKSRVEEPMREALTKPRDVEEIRRRLREGAAGTYVDELLLQRDSALARWPDRRKDPLRVWVQPETPTSDFSVGFPDIVRAAFEEWMTTGIPVTFNFVRDSARADIHVTWINRFD
jgi:hypothetical protein